MSKQVRDLKQKKMKKDPFLAVSHVGDEGDREKKNLSSRS